MVAGVDADHVGQVGRAHGPAELLHHLVDAHEVDAEAQQLGEAAEVREQHTVDQEAGAIVDHDRALAHLLGVGDGGGDGGFTGLLATDHFHQRHHVHRVEEMHAAEVFRTLQRLGQQADGDGRGVGGDDRVFLHRAFHFGEHGLLDLGVLDDGFDDDVDVAEVAIGHGRTDAIERLGHLRRGQATLLDALAEQLGGLVQAHLDTLFADILHQDRGALERRLIGDAAAHDAGAEHGGQFHVLGDFVVFLGFLLQFLVIQEQADQTLRDRGLGQLDEAGGFDFQRLVAAEVGGLLDALDGFHRRRVVRTGLAGDEALGGFEGHHLLDCIQLQLFQLRLAPCLVVQLAGDGALGQVEGSGLQLLGSDHGVDGADLQGVLGLVFLARGDPLDGVIAADQARQADGAAEARVDAQLDFRQADLGGRAHHAEVRGQAHLQAAAEGDAVDRGNGGYVQVFEVAEDLVGFEVARHQFLVGQLEVVNELGDVGTNDEHVLAAGHDHALDRCIGLDRIDCRTQLTEGETVELVDGLALEIEIQLDDAALKRLNRDGFTLVNHQLISTLLWKLELTHRTPCRDPFGNRRA
ncbi:hypothetical protein PAERUG_P48_London_17_VIM_2_01_13_02338 [Pseudomonas aeruginosa]|nr:hypothetical protein PAERUG_P48_London_17_VIM_2_01_13_02338 [Pseudomonas aeruginosa]